MKRNQRFKIFISLLLFLGQTIVADTLYDASILEREGRIDEALVLYEKWLSESTKDPEFTDILIYSASLINSVSDSLDYLFKYESLVDIEKRQIFYLRIARTYELIFQNYRAAEYYKKASRNRDGSLNNKYYLKYLSMDYQHGNIPSMDIVNNILLSETDEVVHIKALIFKAELLKYDGKINEAIAILHQSEYLNTYPELQLALWEAHLLDNNFPAAAFIIKEMKDQFPDSIELKIMEGKIQKTARISDFFLEFSNPAPDNEPDKAYVQVGSFSNIENASDLSEDLKKYNFEYFLFTVGNITKVIVVDSTSPEFLLSRLREKGFDGFKIDYQ